MAQRSDLHRDLLYRELQEYIGWGDDDVQQLRLASPLLMPHADRVIDDFYAEIARHPAAARVITGGENQVQRLKATLRGWLAHLFHGQYDREFLDARWRVGRRHAEIGLNNVYATVALGRMRQRITESLIAEWQGDDRQLHATLRSLDKLLDLDVAIMQLAYQEYHTQQVEADAHERVRQNERLAAIGQMVTGLAHESRNALQRSHACLEMLALDIQDRPQAMKMAQRIQTALEQLHLLYEEVRNYAAPIKLDLERLDLRRLVIQAWANLEGKVESRNVDFRLHFESSDECWIVADRHRMEQVLANLLQNAIEASQAEATPRVECRLERLDSPHWRLTVSDNGPGVPDAHVDQIFDPFFTTKAKGTGLGLAITRRIVEAHQGSITLDPGYRQGAAFELKLPIAAARFLASSP